MEEYLEKLVVQKVELQQANATLQAIIAHIVDVNELELPWSFTSAQLEATKPVNITSEDGITLNIVRANA